MHANDATRIISVIDSRVRKLTGSEAGVETTWGEVIGVSDDGRLASAYLYGETEFASEGFRIPGTLMVAIGDRVKVAWDKRGDRWVTEVANLSASKKIEIDPNAGTIKVGDGTARPSILIADSSGAVVGVHDHDADYADIAHNHDADYEASGAVAAHETDGEHTVLRASATTGATLSSTGHGLQVGSDAGQNLIADTNEIQVRSNGLADQMFLNPRGGKVTIGDGVPGTTVHIDPADASVEADIIRIEAEEITSPAAGMIQTLALFELPAGVNPVEGADLRSGSSAGTNYPEGITLMRITDGSGTGVGAGWPLADGRGTVMTISNTTTLIHQIWFERGSLGNGIYHRNWNSASASWRGWTNLG